MNETLRKAYLSAMGIDVYYPRFTLPGTSITPSYEFDRESGGQEGSLRARISETRGSEETDSARSTAKRTVQRPKAQSLRERVLFHGEDTAGPSGEKAGQATAVNKEGHSKEQSKEQSKEAVSSATASTVSNEVSADEADRLRFAIRYYKVSKFLAVIEEYPLQQSLESRSESLNLLRNILHAINVQSETSDYVAESFNWPLVEGLNENTDEKLAAKQALQGFILGRRRQDEFQNLLVFAGKIDELLVDSPETMNNRDFQASNAEFFTTITHSLQSMLSYPDLKKDVWQQLQALRQRSLSR